MIRFPEGQPNFLSDRATVESDSLGASETVYPHALRLTLQRSTGVVIDNVFILGHLGNRKILVVADRRIPIITVERRILGETQAAKPHQEGIGAMIFGGAKGERIIYIGEGDRYRVARNRITKSKEELSVESHSPIATEIITGQSVADFKQQFPK